MGAITLQMTKDLLTELEREKDGTTPGAWESAIIQEGDGSEYQAVLAFGSKENFEKMEEFVLAMPDPDGDDAFYNPRDFDFIAWCHNAPLDKALRLLIKRVEVLEDALEKAKIVGLPFRIDRVDENGQYERYTDRSHNKAIDDVLSKPLEEW